jgi:hypothetical protein
MLYHTGVSLRNVITKEELRAFWNECEGSKIPFRQKSFLASGVLSGDISTAAAAFGAKLGIGADRDGSTIADIIITEGVDDNLGGNVATHVERLVAANFANLISTTDLKNHVRKRFSFGVVTGNVTGKLSANASASNSGSVNGDMNGDIAGGSVVLRGREAGEVTLSVHGVIGVKVLCFVVKCDAKAHTCQLSAPIPVVSADDRYFKDTAVFVRGWGSPMNVIKLEPVIGKMHKLFQGKQIGKDDIRFLEDASREKYKQVLQTYGKLGPDDTAESDTLSANFGCTSGEELWNANVMEQPRSVEADRKPIFVVTDLFCFQDALCEFDSEMRWFPPVAVPSTVSCGQE